MMVGFEELMNLFDVLQDMIAITNQLDEAAFGSLYCMILEEWCRYHDADVVNQIDMYSQMIKEVNDTCGKY